ncbi:MAG: hypothetical protein JST26_04765 [Bacteroidetes bacterium]|nr:hypothetical protein [Bacteroidota bacterium]
MEEESKNEPKQTKEYAERVKKAFDGKDSRQVMRDIKNQFPERRTAELSMQILQILNGNLMDEDILKAVENLK